MSTMRENFSCSYTFASQQQQSQPEVRHIAPLGPLAPLLHLYRRLCLYSKKAHLPQTAVETDPQGFVLEYTSLLLVHTSCQYSYSFHEWIMIVSPKTFYMSMSALSKLPVGKGSQMDRVRVLTTCNRLLFKLKWSDL